MFAGPLMDLVVVRAFRANIPLFTARQAHQICRPCRIQTVCRSVGGVLTLLSFYNFNASSSASTLAVK